MNARTEALERELAQAQETITLLQSELNQTNSDLLQLTLDLDAQIEERTAKLRHSEQRYMSVAQSVQEALIATDEAGNVVFWNRASQEIFGYGEAEILGKPFLLLLHEECSEKNDQAPKCLRPSNLPRFMDKTTELYAFRKDGTKFPVEFSLSSWLEGEKRFFSAIIRDITERRKTQRIAQRNIELHRLLSDFFKLAALPIGMEETLDRILDGVLSMSDLSINGKGCIFIAEPGSEMLEMAVSRGLDRELRERCARISYGHCLCGQAIDTRQTVFRNRLEDHPRHDRIVDKPHGHYCLPIIKDETVLGVLNIAIAEGHPRFPEQERTLETVANSIAIVIDRKKLELERERLLHEVETQKTQLSMQNDELLRAQMEISQSRDRFSELYDFAPVAYCTISETGRLHEVNLTFCGMVGVERSDLKEKRLQDFIVRDDQDRVHLHLHRLLQSRKRQMDELRLKRPDGRDMDVRLESVMGTEDGNEASFIRTVLMDVSDRKSFERALQASEIRYRDLFGNMSNGVAVYEAVDNGEDFQFKDINKAGERISRIKRRDVVEQSVRRLFPGVVQSGLLGAFRQVWRTGKAVSFPTFLYQDKQLSQWVENFIYKLPSGEIVTVYDDVTERKHAEDALAQSEKRYRQLFDNSADALLVVDAERFQLETVNNRTCGLFGYTDEQCGTLTIFDLLEPEERDRIIEHFEPEKSEPGDVSLRYFRTNGGQVFPGEVYVWPLEQKGRKKFVLSVRDVSSRKKAETDLQQQSEINSAMAEIGAELLSGRFAIGDLSGLVLEHGQRLTASRIGFTGYIDPETGHLNCPTMTRGVWDQCQVDGKATVFKEFTGLWGWVLNNREPLVTNDPDRDSRSTGTPDGHIPIQRFLSVPALIEDRLVGQIALANAERDYTEHDVKICQALANLYALAIHRIHNIETLRSSVKEKEVLLREIHHRVKNNMQVVSGLLQLQASNLEKKKASKKAALNAMRESQGRIATMSLIHEKLYRSDNLAYIDAKSYLTDLAHELSSTFGAAGKGIELETRLEPIKLNLDQAIPCGLIVNELVSNCFKHAFPEGRQGKVLIACQPLPDQMFEFVVKDDGVGFSIMKDKQHSDTLGMRLVHRLARQVRGKITFKNGDGKGLTVRLRLKGD